MAYRRSADDGVYSSRWRIANGGELTRCGIPSEITSADRRWTYVLEHAHDPQTGWDVSWLSPQQGEDLLALLEPLLPNATGVLLVEELQRRRAKRG
jgi:hypothetical protein